MPKILNLRTRDTHQFDSSRSGSPLPHLETPAVSQSSCTLKQAEIRASSQDCCACLCLRERSITLCCFSLSSSGSQSPRHLTRRGLDLIGRRQPYLDPRAVSQKEPLSFRSVRGACEVDVLSHPRGPCLRKLGNERWVIYIISSGGLASTLESVEAVLQRKIDEFLSDDRVIE